MKFWSAPDIARREDGGRTNNTSLVQKQFGKNRGGPLRISLWSYGAAPQLYPTFSDFLSLSRAYCEAPGSSTGPGRANHSTPSPSCPLLPLPCPGYPSPHVGYPTPEIIEDSLRLADLELDEPGHVLHMPELTLHHYLPYSYPAKSPAHPIIGDGDPYLCRTFTSDSSPVSRALPLHQFSFHFHSGCVLLVKKQFLLN